MKKIIIFLCLLMVFLAACGKDEPKEDKKEISTEKKETNIQKEEIEESNVTGPRSATTGLVLNEDFSTNPFSIMVENSKAARPHTGLINADIVYEFEVEGKTTRFLAIFHDEIPEKVGPVRSSRHYFIPVAESYNIPYFHFGGSPYAYSDLESVSIPSYDGITQGKFFKRDSSRKAPHNAYMYTNTINSYDGEIKAPFSFTEDKSTGDILSVSYKYNNYTHIKYTFDKGEKLYTRFLEGVEHIDRVTGESIKVRNILFLAANHSSISGDTSGRINVSIENSGDLALFTNGKRVDGSWEYKDGTFHYYDSNSNELKLNPGQTWVQVVRSNQSIVTE